MCHPTHAEWNIPIPLAFILECMYTCIAPLHVNKHMCIQRPVLQRSFWKCLHVAGSFKFTFTGR